MACLTALFSCLAEQRRFGQREDHDFFASDGADVVMQAKYFDASDLLDQLFQERPRGFDEMSPHLLEQVAPLGELERLDQLLFGRS